LTGVNTRKLLVLIIVLVVLSGSSLFSFEVDASLTGGTVKIMPLGDSITSGYPGEEGYRKNLYLDLINSGFNVDFVGSQKNGTGFDNDNEGHVGFQANQIRDNVYGWLVSNPADVVLLHIGTNDIEEQNAAGIVAEVGGLLDKIDLWESVYGQSVTVVLARIILRSDSISLNTTTKAYDDALEAMALTRIASGDQIIIVDMENALSYPNDLVPDGIHPNSVGYGKMADVWYNALINIIGCSLTVNYVGHGVVTKVPDKAIYPYGTVVNLTAEDDSDWTFSAWTGDLVSSVNPASITMNSNKTVTATFTQIQYKLTITANYGTATPSAGEYWFAAGSTVTISASSPTNGSNERYSWLGWNGSGSGSYNGTNNQVVITMNGPITEAATWKQEYKLSLSCNTGTTTPSTGQYWYGAGTPVKITASPPNSSAGTRPVWAGWTGSGTNSYNGTDNPINIVINGPVSEIASWNTEYKLLIEANLGTAQPSVGDHWYLAGTPVTVEAFPPSVATGVQYVCLGWSGTGSVPASGNTTLSGFTMNAPSNITWSWKTQYYLTVSSAYGSTNGTGWYDAANSAYATVDSTTVTGSNGLQYTFSGWSGDASGSSSPSNIIVMDSPKNATANWTPTPVVTPTPTVAPTVAPTARPTIAPTAHPTASPSPSPTPAVSPSPTPDAGPSTTPSQPPSDENKNATYVYIGLALGVVTIGAIVGGVAFRKSKK
jgi:uncharacterized repeat protein (TIGR02543 family)